MDAALPLWKRIPRPVGAAVLSCFLAGYVAHIYAFTNIIPNADGLSRVYDPQQMTVSGRWFLHYATIWNGFVQAPAVIGFFSVLFLALAAGLTVSLLEVRSPLLAGLCGALMVVFPSVAYTFLYLFTASAYCFAILLAVLAVWLTDRYRWGLLPGVLLLACAIGAYQAYLAAAASLALIRVILFALEGGHSFREVFRRGLRHLLFLVLGLGVYYGVLRLFLWVKDLELLDYKGISDLGSDPLELFRQTVSAYKTFVQYFFIPGSFSTYTTPVAAAGHGVLALGGLWALVRVVRRDRPGPGVLALTLALCCLLPLALNLTVLMGNAMPIMRYALVFTYVLALALADRALAPNPAPPAPNLCRDGSQPSAQREPETASPDPAPPAPPDPGPAPPLLRWWIALAAALLLVVSFNVDNLAYTVSANAHRATESFATRLVERVEATPGYTKDMEVVIIGGFPSEVYYSTVEAFALVDDYSNHASSVIPLNKHVYYYLNDWLNVPWQEPPETLLQAVSDSELFQAMPLYPSDGSIVISEGRVIVKLAAAYRPKQPYEIAYENRR